MEHLLNYTDIMSYVDGEGIKAMKEAIQVGAEEVSYKGEKLQFSKTRDTDFENLRKAYVKTLRKMGHLS